MTETPYSNMESDAGSQDEEMLRSQNGGGDYYYGQMAGRAQSGRGSRVEGMEAIMRDKRAQMITPNHMDWDGNVKQETLTGRGDEPRSEKAYSAVERQPAVMSAGDGRQDTEEVLGAERGLHSQQAVLEEQPPMGVRDSYTERQAVEHNA